MNAQLTIFDRPSAGEPVYPERFRRWLEFHRANPGVWAWFQFFARQYRAKQEKGSARTIGERIRWETAIQVQASDTATYKLNDHLWPYYARLMRATVPGFEDFFDTRGELDVADETIVTAAGARP